MNTNTTPVYDLSDNPTGCCPRFNPNGWDSQALHFSGKPFVRATTKSQDFVPQDMGEVFVSTFQAIQEAGANDDAHSLILSRDLSPSSAEHLFAVTKDLPGKEMVRLTGDYRTKVFEGDYANAPRWKGAFEDELETQGLDAEEMYFFYTTCPKCAATYGKNYVVGVARVAAGT